MQKAFTPIKLRNLTLRNRFIKTATNEGMWIDGLPTQQLADHHARLAKGGIGLTTMAYGAAASIQLTHCGFFTNNRLLTKKRPIAPSRILNKIGRASCKERV